MKIKVCYVYSDVDYSHFVDNTEKFLDKDKYEVTTIFMGQEIPTLYKVFEQRGSAVRFVKYSGRKDLLTAISGLRRIFNELKPDIVHTHLVNASLAGLTAAKLLGIKNRIHTRHHGTECYLYYPHAVYYDKLINFLSSRIIAVSSQVSDILIERDGAARRKVKIIRHGFDLAGFQGDEATTEKLRKLYGLNGHYPVVGVISRFIHLKGIQYIIPAFAKLTKKYPRAKLVLANATGAYGDELKALLRQHLDESQYVIIEFERQVFDLYKTFDVFVHVPISKDIEAFGQTYIEALAMEIPSIFTLSGIANDFIKDKVNAIVVPYCDSEAIAESLELILENAELRGEIIQRGRADVLEMFNVKRYVDELDALYTELAG